MKAKLDVAWAEFVRVNKEKQPRANYNFVPDARRAPNYSPYHPQVSTWIEEVVKVCGPKVTIEFINNDCIVAGCMLFLYENSSCIESTTVL